nr:unnamed protein product [Spirometra erinaceieuropaei]
MWLTSPGRVLLKKSNQQSKFDPLVEEVELLQCNPQYAHIRFSNGREETVSVRQLAPSGEKDVGGCHQETVTPVPENLSPLSPDHPPITEQESSTVSTDGQNDATPVSHPNADDSQQESRRTRLRRIKRYGNEAFQSHWRTPMTFETIPLGDQTDDVPSASDQRRILEPLESYFQILDNSFRNQLTSYLTCLGGHNVDDFVERSLHLQSAFTKCLERSLDSYVLRKQKTQHPRSFY